MARQSMEAPPQKVIDKAISALNSLVPPPKTTIKDVLESHKKEILAALERGNKVHIIAKCLTENGLKTSRETLRQLVEMWTNEPTNKMETQPKKKRVSAPASAPAADIKEPEKVTTVEHKQNFEDKKAAYDNDDI